MLPPFHRTTERQRDLTKATQQCCDQAKNQIKICCFQVRSQPESTIYTPQHNRFLAHHLVCHTIMCDNAAAHRYCVLKSRAQEANKIISHHSLYHQIDNLIIVLSLGLDYTSYLFPR